MEKREKKKRVARQQNREHDNNAPISQEDFGILIGESQQVVSKLCKYSVLSPGGTFRDWMIQWDRFMKGRIFQRQGWLGLARICGD
jgi:hypothetical protein